MFETKFRYNEFLESLGEVLDISDVQLEAAKTSYEAVGRWLSREASPIAKYKPVIYPQGSFRLGTVVKPIADEDNFDVDVVCLLKNLPPEISQKDLKQMVGDALKSNADYERMLRQEEGRRCWTLQYADSRKFHMDILPATNDDFTWLLEANIPYERAKHAIKITDKTCLTYADCRDTQWSKSNPIGYGDWFKERMLEELIREKQILSARTSKSIESIEDYEVKTPLQRAVQILKRHRDFMFGDDEDRPISIIITTLAGHAYSNESNLYDSLIGLLDRMPDHIKVENGKKKVENPVNTAENFADRWGDFPQREENFYTWLTKAKEDFIEIFNTEGFAKSIENLRESFGERIVNEALRRKDLDNFVESRKSIRQANSGIFSVPYRETPRWFMDLEKEVTISARYRDADGKDHTLLSSYPLPKDVEIRFTAITDVRKPFSVFWQVVNTGQEAAAEEKGLRGEIFPAKIAGSGGLRHKETTLYEGTHWIECFIVKEGVCVARSREFIVKIGAK